MKTGGLTPPGSVSYPPLDRQDVGDLAAGLRVRCHQTVFRVDVTLDRRACSGNLFLRNLPQIPDLPVVHVQNQTRLVSTETIGYNAVLAEVADVQISRPDNCRSLRS